MAETTWIPGMAARDPETGWQYRAVEMQRALGWAHVHGWAQPTDARWVRALAAGPDLADLTTAAVYAAQHRWGVRYNRDSVEIWTDGIGGNGWHIEAATLPDAVQAAAKAERGVTCTGCELADDCPGFADCPKLAAAKAEGER